MYQVLTKNGTLEVTNIAQLRIKIGRMAHQDNYSFWEDRLSKADEDALDEMALAAADQIEEGLRTTSRFVTLFLELPLVFDLMEQHAYLGDVADASGDKELRAIGLAHQRAAISIWKTLTKHGLDVTHPEHWWKGTRVQHHARCW